QQRQLDLIRRRHLRVLVEVLQQIAGVFGNQVNGMVLDGRYVCFAAADAVLPTDGEAVCLQRLRPDLGDDLRLRKVGGANDDRLEVTGGGSAAEWVGAAARCGYQREHGRQDRKTQMVRGSSRGVHANVLSASPACGDHNGSSDMSPRFGSP